MNGFERVKFYGSRIDEVADAFLSKDPSDLYGMLRYFMGYADETFAPLGKQSGKRMRPALLLYIAEACGVSDKAMPAALSIELFHNFSLIHDDIEDNDELRRGRPTVWKLWGVNKALNAGDAQLVLAFEALTDMPSSETSRALHRFLLGCYREVIEGQHLDFALAEARLDDPIVSEETYLRMIAKKSAALIGASAAAPGYLAGLGVDATDALYAFGKELGIAYQLYDDHQSLWGTSAETGKAVGGDMRERKKTLPVIYAREHVGPSERDALIRGYFDSASDMRPLLEIIEASGARAPLVERIRIQKERALAVLAATALPAETTAMLTEFIHGLIPS